MPENVYVADIAAHEGQEVTLHGWLHNRRSSGKLHFLQVRDGTGTIQCVVFKGNVTPETFTDADHPAPPSASRSTSAPSRCTPGRRRSSPSATRSTASPS
jgi:aspartyl/asparaginyl-tRNA synthetase